MEGSRTKVDVMKPLLFKAGIPVAISVAGFIFSRFMTWKSSILKASSSDQAQVNSLQTSLEELCRHEESFLSLDSTSLTHNVEDEIFSTDIQQKTSAESLQTEDRCYKLEEEVEGLKTQIEGFQAREWKLGTRFLHYQDLKEQELILVELLHRLVLEIDRVEFLDRELHSIEAENKRFEGMVAEFLNVLEQLECSRMENGLLHRKVQKLLRELKERSRALEGQNLQIKKQRLCSHEEIERRAAAIKGLEDEIDELKTVVMRLQEEKSELINQLEMAAENPASSKNEAEGVVLEDYYQLLNELEQLQKDRTAEINELIYLRWCNACLRHELMRRNQEQEEKLDGNKKKLDLESGGSGDQRDFGLERELDGLNVQHSEACLGLTTGLFAHSKRRRLIEKFKRWVEGEEKGKQRSEETGIGWNGNGYEKKNGH
ncbi:LOW QUALITY PROTEIN: hypothetical protein RJ640_024113 [Escallonia rubra]|uniref:Protein CHUP1, chloroplastic n=1 Tax=Escallonia rubra TaxID=112253 RepID=A0AA88U1K9_9ASTE|nr:LOW QUALITY PROTEIN: hypothetical protein RJ640_024113 [Escallonia rubra]